MFCPKCGKEVEQDDLFCWNCGAKMKKPTEETELLNDVAKNESIKESAVSIQGEACDYTKLPTEKKSGIRGIYFFDFIKNIKFNLHIPNTFRKCFSTNSINQSAI